MLNKKKAIFWAIGIIIFIAVIFGAFYLLRDKDQPRDDNKPVNQTSGPFNEETAIEFAKKDEDFVNAANKFESYFNFELKLLYSAYFDEEENCWVVSVWPEDTNDLWYYIKFNDEGTIIKKAYGEGA